MNSTSLSKYALVLALLVPLLACHSVATDPSKSYAFLDTGNPDIKVVAVQDKFVPDCTMLATTLLKLKTVGFIDPSFIYMEPRYYIYKDAPGEYAFAWTYSGDGWVFWDDMTLLVGGKPYVATEAYKPQREVVYGSNVMERCAFVIPPSVFETLLDQGIIDIRLNGRQTKDFRLSGKDLDHLKALRDQARKTDPKYPQL